ncbi:MAG TPA: hypothetical protein VF081_12040 [Solirubrobacterales bacterium]
MNGRRAIVGLCMLCALLVSAFGAQSASAITGTTGFTCVKEGGDKKLRGTHCLTTGIAEQNYGHVAVAQNLTTEGFTTNEKTANNTTESTTGRLKVTIAGVPLELTANTGTSAGWGENRVAENGEHYVYGEGTTTLTGVKVSQPAGRGCKVFTDNEATKTKGEEGAIHSRVLKATTQGQGDFGKLEPKEGTSFANFFIECEVGKQIPAIEGTWECTGTIKGAPVGGTIIYTHAEATTANTLKCKGAKAGVELATTGGAREKGSTGPFTAGGATTVTT